MSCWDQGISVSRGGDNDAIQELAARDSGVELCFLFQTMEQEEGQGVVVAIAALGNALHQAGEKGILKEALDGERDDQADDVCSAAGQGAGDGIRAEAGFGDHSVAPAHASLD